MATSEVIKLGGVRLSFPKLFTPKAFVDKDGNKSSERFEAAFLLDPSDKTHAAIIADIVEKATDLANEQWHNKIPKSVELCFGYSDAQAIAVGDLKWHGKEKEYDGYEGMFYISSANRTRPTVVDRDRSPLVEADGKPYPGCIVNASITLWTQDNQWGKRINANLRAVQFVKDGEAFGAKPVAAEDEFDVVDGDEDDGFLD